MAGENTMDTLQGWFKELYASQEINLVPEAAYLTKNVAFKKSEAGLGNLYHQPVVLSQEQGFTYAGPSAGAFALNSPVAAVMKDAQVQGAQLLLRSQIDYETLARAANTKGSFGEASKLLVKNMVDAIAKRLELMYLYGRSAGGIATLSAGGLNQTTFTISAATWAPGIWAGLEGARIQVLSVTGSLPSLSVGVNRTGSGGSGATVASVDFSTRIVTCAAALSGTTTSGDIVIFYGSWVTSGSADLTNGAAITFNEAMGLDGMVSQQTGTLFNINIGTYSLFRGNTTSGLSSLTVTKILNSLLPAIGKGLMDDVVMLVSNTAFQGLVNPVVDPSAQAGSSNVKVGANVNKNQGDSLVLGARSIKLIGYQGIVEVVPHLFVKDNDTFSFPKAADAMMRVGATDVTFNTPGSKGGEFFLHMPSNAGYELRCYANQGLFSPRIGHITKATL